MQKLLLISILFIGCMNPEQKQAKKCATYELSGSMDGVNYSLIDSGDLCSGKSSIQYAQTNH